MCFTIELNVGRQTLENEFGATFADNGAFEPGYYFNAFNLPLMPVITAQDPQVIQVFQWGLIPFWVKDETQANDIRYKTMNARSESLTQKVSYKHAVKRKRCIVLGHGFFEWHHYNGKKYPFYIKLKNDRPFGFSGLYDMWTDRTTGTHHQTFSLITTPANPMLERIHNSRKRMPAILEAENTGQWISPQNDLNDALGALQPLDENKLEAYPVSPLINKRATDKNVPEIIQPFSYPDLDI